MLDETSFVRGSLEADVSVEEDDGVAGTRLGGIPVRRFPGSERFRRVALVLIGAWRRRDR